MQRREIYLVRPELRYIHKQNASKTNGNDPLTFLSPRPAWSESRGNFVTLPFLSKEWSICFTITSVDCLSKVTKTHWNIWKVPWTRCRLIIWFPVDLFVYAIDKTLLLLQIGNQAFEEKPLLKSIPLNIISDLIMFWKAFPAYSPISVDIHNVLQKQVHLSNKWLS